ncbi:hypothetical protein [Scytonema sp. PCC 10023]
MTYWEIFLSGLAVWTTVWTDCGGRCGVDDGEEDTGAIAVWFRK